jgi:hypothetical protein
MFGNGRRAGSAERGCVAAPLLASEARLSSRPTMPDALLSSNELRLSDENAPESELAPPTSRTTLGPFRCVREAPEL